MKSHAPVQASETRQRLIDAAANVFAEEGFRRATVREICSRAGANVAAVNYHFRGKQGLHAEVLRHGLLQSLQRHPPDGGLSPASTPEEQLRAFIHSFLMRLLDSGRHSPHARIMVREMIEPTGSLDVVVRDHIRPLSQRLLGIVRRILGPAASQEATEAAAMSIVGQCCFYRHAEQVIEKLFPRRRHSRQAINRLAEHITRFSLAGLRACALAASGRKARRSRHSAEERP